MKPNIQTDTQSVGALIQQLGAQAITRDRFNVEMPVDDVKRLLWAYYCRQVKSRGHSPIFDDEIRNCIVSVAEWLVDPTGKNGLMLQGRYGNGKTTMMMAVVTMINALFYSVKHDDRVQARRIDAKEVIRVGLKDSTRDEFRSLVHENILAIDDLGEEPAEVIMYGMTYTPMKDLLLERYKHNKMTLVTTNLINTPESPELVNHYGERLVDRMREMMKIVVFRNDSYRKVI